MKRVFLSLALLALMAVGMLSISSCKKEKDGAKCILIEDYNIQEENASLFDCLSSIVQPQQLVIINSQDEYDSLFPNCPLSTNIDFESKTLYAVYGYTISCILRDDISTLCNGNNVSITIDIITGDCPSAENWIKVFTSNKIGENQIVSLTINQISS